MTSPRAEHPVFALSRRAFDEYGVGVPCVLEAISPEQFAEVRTLMRAYFSWQRERHHDVMDILERYYSAADLEAEISQLPGKYVRPRGVLLLALADGKPAGCVGLRDLGCGVGEVKRMFVAPTAQRRGIGRLLVSTVIEEARQMGFSTLRLDTGVRQVEAQHLYRQAGFKAIEPYYELTDELRSWLLFMELDLGSGQND